MWHRRGSHGALRAGEMVPVRTAMPVRAVMLRQTASPFGVKSAL